MLWMQYESKKFNCAMWQNQKFLCIGLGPVSVSACRGSQKQQMFDLKGDGVLSLGFVLIRGVAVAGLEGLLVAGSQGNKTEPKQTTKNEPSICL